VESLESRRLFSATPSFSLDSSGLVSTAGKGNLKLPYSYYVTGNSGNSTPTLTAESAGLALAGGGLDVDEVFRWMGAKITGPATPGLTRSIGDFLVIRATGTNAYNAYIDRLVPDLDSVATLVIPDLAAATHPDVARIIGEAESIFIAGGDQGSYITYWNDTPVEQEIYKAILRNAPIGGTSAGLAVLGEIDFSGVAGSITSAEALSNPLDIRIRDGLNSKFLSPEESAVPTILKYMDNLITDSHFMQRDREGRLLTFMANMDARNLVPSLPRAIGVNEQTALLIESDGMAKVVGNSYNRKLSPNEQLRNVYLFQGNTLNPPNPLDPLSALTAPLTYSAQGVIANYDPSLPTPTGDRFKLDDLFASSNWSHQVLDQYDLSAVNGVISRGTLAANFVNYYDPNYSDTDSKRRSRPV
jgi:cyanophycinase